MSEENEPPKIFRVVITDTADADMETLFLVLTGYSPAFAGRWLDGLTERINSLSLFPYRNAPLPNRPDRRRLLYGKYLIVYRVREASDEADEAEVQTIHIHHGARSPLDASDISTETG